MRRSITPGGVARQLNGQPFALLAPCHARASTPEKGNLFLHKPLSWKRSKMKHAGMLLSHAHPRLPLYSVLVARGYRAVGKRDDNAMLWFWLGSHADHDKLLLRQ